MRACADKLFFLCVCVFGGDPCRKGGKCLHWQPHKGKWSDFKAGVQLNCRASKGESSCMKWQTDSPNTYRHSQGPSVGAHTHIYCTTAFISLFLWLCNIRLTITPEDNMPEWWRRFVAVDKCRWRKMFKKKKKNREILVFILWSESFHAFSARNQLRSEPVKSVLVVDRYAAETTHHGGLCGCTGVWAGAQLWDFHHGLWKLRDYRGSRGRLQSLTTLNHHSYLIFMTIFLKSAQFQIIKWSLRFWTVFLSNCLMSLRQINNLFEVCAFLAMSK